MKQIKQKQNTKLAIVTVNYNKPDSMKNLIESIKQSTHRDLKLYVVDNNSTLDSQKQVLQALKDSNLEYEYVLNKENVGWGMALNEAFKHHIKEDLTLVINNDTKIQPETIPELINTMNEHPEVGICGVKILHPDGSLATTGGRIDWLTRLTGITRENKARHNTKETVILNSNEFVDDCCWIIRTEIMNYVKYPPHLFLYFEELWIVDGARKFGYEIAYNPKAIIYHS